MRPMLVAVSCLPLWSCTGAGEAPAAGEERICDTATHAVLVGQPASEIDTGVLPEPFRVHSAGSRVTMDHRPDRLNIVVGADGRVVRVHCG